MAIIILLSTVVFGLFIYIGYRVNMYLYSQGAVGTGKRSWTRKEPVSIETVSAQTGQRMAKRERDEGLRYARIGIALVLVLSVSLLVILLLALVSLFH